MGPRAIEAKLENEVEKNSASCRDEKQQRRVFVFRERKKQRSDADDHEHNCTSTKRCDFNHRGVETVRVPRMKPSQNTFIESLCPARHDGFRDLGKSPSAKRRYDYTGDKKYSEGSQDRTGALEDCL